MICLFLILSFFATYSYADVRRDPMCPYPSDVETFYPDPYDCTTFYECYAGEKYVMQCGDGLFWNDKTKKCDYKENVNCTPIPEPPTPSTTRGSSTPSGNSTSTPDFTPDPSCPYPSEVITYDFVPGNCTAFYECDHGRRYLFNCDKGLEWNHIHNYCDYPENVDCSRSTTTTHSTIPTTLDPRCGGQPDGVLLPDEHDCSKYYECDRGQAVSMSCPPGTEFDPDSKRCDYPQNSHCTPKFYL